MAKTKNKIKKSPFDIAFVSVNTLILIIFTVVTLYPILNTLAVSFNDGYDSLRGGVTLIPRKFTLLNYQQVLKKETLWQATIVTVARTVIGTLTQMVCTALLAYVLTRKEFLLNKFVTIFYVLTMYVSGGLVPTLLLFKGLHLTNSFWVYVVPGFISAYNMIVIRTYMNGLPDSLGESAQVDGAGHMRIFWKIILPLCKPVMATVALFIAVYHWNSWFDAMLYNQGRPDLSTLQYELMKLLSGAANQHADANLAAQTGQLATFTPTSLRSATTIITALPIVCLYPFLQRYFVTGLTIGGVKE